MVSPAQVRFEGASCTITIVRPRPGLLVVEFEGRDAGELGDAPFQELDRDIRAYAPVALFIDARGAQGATLDVSAQWAQWLGSRKHSLHVVNMLTGSRFIHVSADFVRQFAELGDRMRVFTDAAAFDTELAGATR
jgi:hypothetical protein